MGQLSKNVLGDYPFSTAIRVHALEVASVAVCRPIAHQTILAFYFCTKLDQVSNSWEIGLLFTSTMERSEESLDEGKNGEDPFVEVKEVGILVIPNGMRLSNSSQRIGDP